MDACETSCGHGFCEFCLNKCLEQKPGLCPVCQKDPSPIHPSYTIRSIVESIRKISDNDATGEVDTDEPSSTESVESLKAAGDACHNQKKYAEAIKHYSQALHKSTSGDARNAVLFNNRAQCYIKIAQYRRALEDCDEAIKLDASNIKAYIRRADCLNKLGEFDPSRQAYLHALRVDVSGVWTEHINKQMAALPYHPNLNHPQPQTAPFSMPPHSQAPPHINMQARAPHPAYPVHYPQPPRSAYPQAGAQPQAQRQTYHPQYPGYTYAQYPPGNSAGASASASASGGSGSGDRRRGHDSDGCILQ